MVLVNFNMGYLVFFMVSVVDVIVNLIFVSFCEWGYEGEVDFRFLKLLLDEFFCSR